MPGMKIEQLLVQHFYNNRVITLQGMGTFTLSPDFVLPMENDKEVAMPENAISFHYNPKATEDDALINFIVQQTRKIKPLASADLDSYLVLGKQFLNIGKPFKIEGVGILEKNQQGDYEFMQGHYANSKLEAAPAALKEKTEDEDISFAAIRHRSRGGGKKILLICASIVVLALIGWAAWHFLHREKTTDTENVSKNDSVQTTAPVTTPPDTSRLVIPKKDSILQQPVAPPTNEDYTFKVVFKETIDKAAAIAKMKDLTARGHKVMMYTKDSVYYKLAEPFKLPLFDTTRIKDSLNKYYYKDKAYIELN
jgi:hypothetical protein